MPSPIGHALAGAAIAWTLDPPNGRGLTRGSDPGVRPRVLMWTCAALAMAPDLDLLTPYEHRTATHSLVAVMLVAILAIGVTRKVTGRVAWRIVVLCGAAYASHLLLDWFSQDTRVPRGLQILWPFGDHWFISDWDLFRSTSHFQIFTVRSIWINLTAVAQEIAILGPIAALARWSVRVKAAARLPAEMPGRHHAAQ